MAGVGSWSSQVITNRKKSHQSMASWDRSRCRRPSACDVSRNDVEVDVIRELLIEACNIHAMDRENFRQEPGQPTFHTPDFGGERAPIDREAEFLLEANRQLGMLAQDDVRSGMRYVSQLKDGSELVVSQFVRGDAAHGEVVTGDYAIEESALLAQNSEDRLVGYRLTQVKEPFGELRAMGYTRASIGGEGIATSLEEANSDYLQRLSNQVKRPIVQVVSNSNADDIRRLREAGASAAVLEAKEAEQQRWQAMYGTGGSLGFDERGRKVIAPVEGGQGLQKLTDEQERSQLEALSAVRQQLSGK